MNFSYARNIPSYRLIIILFSLLFFPSLVYVTLDATSTALGLLVALVLVLILTVGQSNLSYGMLVYLLFILIFLFLYNIFIVSYGGYEADSRMVSSGFFVIYMVLLSYFFSGFLLSNDNGVLKDSLFVITLVSVFLGLYSFLLDQNFLGYDQYPKSVFPFAEPSHYVITLGPILFASGFFFSLKSRAALIFFTLSFAILSPSVTMVLFSLLMIVFFFKWSWIKVILIFPFILMLFYFLLLSEQGSYFIDRLSFSDSSTNLTALVYMQGWSDMVFALQESNWLGIGFQNLGILSPSYYGELIYSLAGEYKNRNDGGFLASKIISEFGILGILFICFYFLTVIKSSLFLIKIIKRDSVNCYSSVYVFSNAVIVAFFIELFARGSGYFTPGFFLVLVSFFVLYCSRKMWQKGHCFE